MKGIRKMVGLTKKQLLDWQLRQVCEERANRTVPTRQQNKINHDDFIENDL